jgi:hypothetical protein
MKYRKAEPATVFLVSEIYLRVLEEVAIIEHHDSYGIHKKTSFSVKFYECEPPNELRIDVAGRAKVEAPVHCAATSIRVELSRFGEVKELLGDYPRITGIMCERKSKTVP